MDARRRSGEMATAGMPASRSHDVSSGPAGLAGVTGAADERQRRDRPAGTLLRRRAPAMVGGAARATWYALAAYIVVTLAATWPLARGLGRDVAWDLGDSLLNMWILAWDSEQLLALLRGDLTRLATFFEANIFHPAPLTLAYSELLLPQAIQALPVYAISGNPILIYNLLFLSTFVLCGLGTFLLVRELTGSPMAAFVAGLLFAFAPYRIPQSPHLQVLSAQWMPFALYGFRRYMTAVEQGRPAIRPLAGAAAALVLQNLSCGYYLLYFTPFAAAYVLWEIAVRDLWRRWRMWMQLCGAAAAVLALTVPFLLPYLVVAEELQFVRSRAEVVRFSADVHSYATAFAAQPLWGDVMNAFPKPEGDLFPGLVTLLLALAGLFYRNAQPPTSIPRTGGNVQPPVVDSHGSRWESRLASWGVKRRVLVIAAGAACGAHLVAALAGLAYRRIALDLTLFELQISNINQMLLRAGICGALLLALSPAARRRAAAFARGPGFAAAAVVAAAWLSLGPSPQVQGRPVEIVAPYAFLYEVVPGFAGVRVPARFGMIAALMLAVLGGLGAARLARLRRGGVVLAVLSVAALSESAVLPFVVNAVTTPPGYNTPAARVYRPQRAPNVYRQFARLAPAGVLAELPLGEPDFDLRAMYYSTVHWRPLLNGYSGYYPPHYGKLALAVSDVPRFPDQALEALRTLGATHVIVHEGAYLGDRGTGTVAALLARGARELYREDGDVLLQLP